MILESRQQTGTRWVAAAALVCLLTTAGCGGSTPDAAGKPGTPALRDAAPGESAADAALPATQPARENPAAAENPVVLASHVRDLPDSTEGETLFVVIDPPEDAFRYQIDSTVDIDAADRFAVSPISPGVDSTTFAVLPGAKPADASKDKGAAPKSRYERPRAEFVAIPEAGVNSEGLPWRLRCEADGAVMALVPAGTFIQGKKNGPPNARPEHAVLLDDFYIDVTEVTAEQYEAYRKARALRKKVVADPGPSADPRHPVLGVNWGDAQLYSHWAGKELPTEAQWEKAARGPDGFDFPWGNGTELWERPRTPGQIDVVGIFQGDLSPYGAFDMAGNAREWCLDWYQETGYEQLLEAGSSTPKNPTGPKTSGGAKQRVVKGGDPEWNVWARAGILLTERPRDVGFRCVLPLKLLAPDPAAGPKKPATSPKKTGQP